MDRHSLSQNVEKNKIDMHKKKKVEPFRGVKPVFSGCDNLLTRISYTEAPTSNKEATTLHMQPRRVVGPGGQQPGLARVEETIHHAEPARDGMAPEDLDRDNEGVLHEVTAR
jgi:hypothetical protein